MSQPSAHSETMPDMFPTVPMPINRDAERRVLGCLLNHPAEFDDVRTVLQPEAFQFERHVAVYKAIEELRAEGEAVDVVTVAAKLRGSVNGFHITEIEMAACRPHELATHARIVAEFAMRRALRTMAIEALGMVRDEESPFEMIGELQTRLTEILERAGGGKTYKALTELSLETIDVLEALCVARRSGAAVGVETGFIDIDRRVGGYRQGEFVIVAARPSMGKTAWALEMARRTSMRGNRIGFFSLEMPATQLVTRLLAIESGVAVSTLRGGWTNDDQWAAVTAKVASLSGLPVYFDDTGSQTITRLCARARVMARRESLSLIMVDYLGLVENPGESREREVSGISAQLRVLARSLNIPVLCLQQLNRGVESRADKRPMLSDLRDSGSIEQDADVVHFLYRPEYYGIRDDDGNDNAGLAEFITAKFRNGETGMDKLAFDGPTTSFRDYTPQTEHLPAPRYNDQPF